MTIEEYKIAVLLIESTAQLVNKNNYRYFICIGSPDSHNSYSLNDYYKFSELEAWKEAYHNLYDNR